MGAAPHAVAAGTCNNPKKIDADIQETNVTNAQEPRLAWTGSGYGLTWIQNPPFSDEVFFAPLDSSGNKVGSDTHVGKWQQEMTWTGSEFAVVYVQGVATFAPIKVQRLDGSGTLLGDPCEVTGSDGIEPAIVWTGSEYGVAWNHQHQEIHFARLTQSCQKIVENRVTVPDGFWSRSPRVVWTGSSSEYGIAWADDRHGESEIYFARLDAQGNKIGTEVRVTDSPGSSNQISLVWTGLEYGLAWVDTRHGSPEVFFTRLDASGNKIGGDVLVGTGNRPSLSWIGAEYGIAWDDDRDGNEEIYFARLNPQGLMVGEPLRVTTDPSESQGSILVWNGSEYALVWRDNRTGDWQVYFTRIGCAAPDSDGDGAPADVDCNDLDASVFPGAPELCDGKDNDCDGLVPDIEADADADGVRTCEGDCDDADPDINPGAVELPGNNTDENCDGSLGACDPNASWKNHGQFVRCVAHEVDELVAAGEITEEEGDDLINSAARSNVGK